MGEWNDERYVLLPAAARLDDRAVPCLVPKRCRRRIVPGRTLRTPLVPDPGTGPPG